MPESAHLFRVLNADDSRGSDGQMQSNNGITPLQASAFSKIVENIVSNPDSASTQILNDQFRKDGIGCMSSLYRALSGIGEKELLIERWSYTLEISAFLWDKGYNEAAVRMLKIAEKMLCPPRLYEEYISNSVRYGEDYILFKNAKEKFLIGEDDNALECIGKMSKLQRSHQLKKFQKLGVKRCKTRRLAFLLAIVVGLFYVVATVKGLAGLQEVIRNPHEISGSSFNSLN